MVRLIQQLDLPNVAVGTDGLWSIAKTLVWNKVKALKKNGE